MIKENKQKYCEWNLIRVLIKAKNEIMRNNEGKYIEEVLECISR
jgi:hypothetical protein